MTQRVIALADRYAEDLVEAVPLPESLIPAISGTLLSFLVDAVKTVNDDE